MNAHDIHHPSWKPPHCPNPDCKYHKDLHGEWPYKRMGSYVRQAEPKRIRRFLCLCCRVSFSSQTFATTYYLKRPDILPRLMTLLTGCMANRQIADHLGVAPATVDRQTDRLGRHCLAYHALMMRGRPAPHTIAIDGLESFELSQYYPVHFHVAVDCASGVFVHFTDSPLRRKGTMTPAQKARREELEARFGRPDPGAVRKDVAELLQTVVGDAGEITIRTDGHKSYPPAIGELRAIVRHEVTSSEDYRDRHNPLFEINLLDLLIRHGLANHKRETIAWAKRRQRAALRLAVFLVWRNYVRPRWKKRCTETPAMQAGMLDRALTVEEIIGRRLFIAQVGLQGRWSQYYWGEVETPALGVNLRHELKRAA
jgi:transposase-like protein